MSEPSRPPWAQLSEEDRDQAWQMCVRAMEALIDDLSWALDVTREHAEALVAEWPQSRRAS